MRRLIGSMALGAALLLATVPVASASDSTCSELFGYPHGYHVLADYVTGAGSEFLGGPGIDWPPAGGAVGDAIGGSGADGAGGPGAGHLSGGIAPGASFCNSQSQAPGFHVPG